MELEDSIGNHGTFYYPKFDLIATTMILKDVVELTKAYPEEKAAIIKVRENLNTIRTEELRGKKIIIHYETKIPHLDQWDLKHAIINAEKNLLKAKVTKKEWDFI
jgi:hypothetical protein